MNVSAYHCSQTSNFHVCILKYCKSWLALNFNPMFGYEVLLSVRNNIYIFWVKVKIKDLCKCYSLGFGIEDGNVDRAMAQAVCRRPLSSSEWELWRTKWHWAILSPNISVSLSNKNSPNSIFLCSFITEAIQF
jgi:hypothetical protein